MGGPALTGRRRRLSIETAGVSPAFMTQGTSSIRHMYRVLSGYGLPERQNFFIVLRQNGSWTKSLRAVAAGTPLTNKR